MRSRRRSTRRLWERIRACAGRGRICLWSNDCPGAVLRGVGNGEGEYFFGKFLTPKPQPQNPVVTSQTPQPTIISSSSPGETANWKTYTNTQFGYSLKYPSSSSGLTNFTCDNEKRFGLAKNELASKACLPGDLYRNTIEVMAAFTNQPQKEDDFTGYPETTLAKENIVIDGVRGFKLTYTKIAPAPYPDKWNIVVVYQKGILYNLVFAERIPLDSAYESIFNQILSTFKFIP